ncbi:hypothetical protein NKJ74_19845 [Mesorhizobium sp. M0046]|uniref:hypothetical protein n=1 Tax=Mesorhizobium sp. M0046 TaxID=2956858 RepID=UPI003338178D
MNVFHEVRFPLATGTTRKDIAVRLEGVPDLRQENAQFWNWLGRHKATEWEARAPNAIAAGVTMEDGTPVLGNLELKGRFLILSIDSVLRAAKGTTLLETYSARRCAPVDDNLDYRANEGLPKGREASSDEFPLEAATPLVHAMLDKQYREILDESVGILGDISPRSAIRTKKGREKVAMAQIPRMPVRKFPKSARPMATYASAGCGANSTSKTFAVSRTVFLCPNNVLRPANVARKVLVYGGEFGGTKVTLADRSPPTSASIAQESTLTEDSGLFHWAYCRIKRHPFVFDECSRGD